MEAKTPKTRVLVVDDSPLIRKGIRGLLEPLDMDIFEAGEGQEALDLAFMYKFDLIITDIDIPELNGLEFCRRLKNNPDTRGIPVIMVSSFDTDADIDMGFLAGASAYLSKREARTYLAKMVEEVLSESTFHHDQLIIIVDDSRYIRTLVEDGLAKAGFKVITAENGKIAIDLIKMNPPDLILSDIEMPEMNGFELCEAIHADPALAAIPFVVMSTMSDRGSLKRMIQQGAAAYIVKPFNIDQLIIQIDRLLSDQFRILLAEKDRLEHEQALIIASITSLVSALEARDSYTKGHSENVARIASGMAALIGLSKKEIEMVLIGGKLHDIGKIGIRDDVLLKKGPLTEKEFYIIKQHPVIGANILRPISSLGEIVSMVLHHHERIDGKGYPAGLKNGEIPQWARIVAIADTYDALTSNRTYRNAKPKEVALQIIEDVRGTQLCPEHVEVFLKWIEQQQ